jgi:hypothetical protein
MLEQKIKEHAREIFDSEPAAGHRERFAERLNAGKKKKIMSLYKYLGYAAAIVLAVVLAVPQWRTWSNENQAQLANTEESVIDVRNYYDMQLEHEIATIEPLLNKIEENERKKVRIDIESVRKDPVPENNIALIVKVYNLKIEALQHIHELLSNNI